MQKWGLFPLAWIGLAPLFWAASEMDAKARLRYGWRAGFFVLRSDELVDFANDLFMVVR